MIIRDSLSLVRSDNKIENNTNELQFLDSLTTSKKLSELGGGDTGTFSNFICDEDIVKGQFLNFLSTEKVASIGNKVLEEKIPFPTNTNFYYQSPSTGNLSVSFDPFRQNKVAVTYAGYDTSQYTYIAIVIGTILDDGTILFGTENIVSGEVYDGGPYGVYDPLVIDRFFLSYQKGSSSLGYTRACSISGDIITAGPVAQFSTTFADGAYIIVDPFVKGRYAISFRNSTAYGALCGVTCGDTGIIATPAAISYYTATSMSYQHAAYDKQTSGRVIVTYSRSNVVYAVVGTFTGTSGAITYGAENSVGVTVSSLNVCHFSLNTTIITYTIDTFVYYKVGTINGNAITFGTQKTIVNALITTSAVSMQRSISMPLQLVVTYGTSTASYAIIGTISTGTLMTFGTPYTITTGTSLNMDQDPFYVGRFANVSKESGLGIIRMSQIAVTTTNLRVGYTIGVAKQSGSLGNYIRVQMGGVCSEFNNLTPGVIYYIQSDGTLSTNISAVKAGTAINTTSLLLIMW